MHTQAATERDTRLRNWWNYSDEEVCQILEAGLADGLSDGEAKRRLQKFGLNGFPEKRPVFTLKIFAKQFNSFIVQVLLLAALISGVLGDWIDASAIGIIILLNAILGFVQEHRAEKSLAALRKLSTPLSKVIRDKTLKTVPSQEIVPGDLLLLEAGDHVPADGRVTQSSQLRTQEAALTGESLSVNKISERLSVQAIPIGDRKNMVFMGTVAVHGKGHVLVTSTGLDTELGKIASLLQAPSREETPLEIQLKQVGQRLVVLFLGVVSLVFVLGLLRGNPLMAMLLTALSLAVAAIPEGLPAVVTIALAIGVRRMAKRNALIRRLASVETLGCTTVICTDKTGTLTQNEMTVRHIWVPDQCVDITGVGYSSQGKFLQNHQPIQPQNHPELMLALKIALLCNNAGLSESDGKWQIAGDPTEVALLSAGLKAGYAKKKLEEENPFLEEIPFSSDRKRMSILRKTENGRVLFVKGAPDMILNLSKSIFTIQNEIPLTADFRKKIEAANHRLASQALRVLAVAYKAIESPGPIENLSEKDLVFVGLIAMIDPPRLEVKKAIEICKIAGIQTVMITGDHKETAMAIARELGIVDKTERAIDGAELDLIDDAQLKDIIGKTRVYSRVSAEHKLRIVKTFKALGEVVAMTGDGVNDAPAVKEADIGIAMGITGTDVTKEASDMVITDDNFTSIVHAVEEGRGIYENIVKFVNYLLSTNIAEILLLFFAILLDLRDSAGNTCIPLSAIQLLWLNLVTDGFPAIALGVDPINPKVMEMPPRKPEESILSLSFIGKILLVGILIACATLGAVFYGLKESTVMAQTMGLTSLIVLQLVRVQIVRAAYHLAFFSNPWLIAALLNSLIFQLIIIYTPVLQPVFGTAPLGISHWIFILITAVCAAGIAAAAPHLINFMKLNKKL